MEGVFCVHKYFKHLKNDLGPILDSEDDVPIEELIRKRRGGSTLVVHHDEPEQSDIDVQELIKPYNPEPESGEDDDSGFLFDVPSDSDEDDDILHVDFWRNTPSLEAKFAGFKKDEEGEAHNKVLAALCIELATMKSTPTEIIENKRKKIKAEILAFIKGTTNVFEVMTLPKMYSLYDKYFFGNKLDKVLKENNRRIVLCWNNKCTKTAGLSYGIKWPNYFNNVGTSKIEISAKVIQNIKSNMEGRSPSMGNIPIKDELDAIMITFEHELIHSIQFCFCVPLGGSKRSPRNFPFPGNYKGATKYSNGHSKTFMSILHNIFGHTDYRHDFFAVRTSIHSSKELRKNFKIDQDVTFVDSKDNTYYGIIKGIGRKNSTMAKVNVYAIKPKNKPVKDFSRLLKVPFNLLKLKEFKQQYCAKCIKNEKLDDMEYEG